MALNANREVDQFVDQEIRRYPVTRGVRIFKGSFVGLNWPHRFARPLRTGHPSDLCAGLAYESVNNTEGQDAERSVRVYTLGDFLLPLAGATRSDIDWDRKSVYAIDDETLTFEAYHRAGEWADGVSIPNAVVGVCVDVPAGGQIILRLDPYRMARRTP